MDKIFTNIENLLTVENLPYILIAIVAVVVVGKLVKGAFKIAVIVLAILVAYKVLVG